MTNNNGMNQIEVSNIEPQADIIEQSKDQSIEFELNLHN
jgi:hypothetical protein